MKSVGIVLISHSPKVVEGIKDILNQVANDVPVELAGGTDQGGIGTSIEKIQSAIDRAHTDSGVLIIYDLGSAMMNAEVAVEMSEFDDIEIANAPLLEGAYVAAVESSMGKSLSEVQQAAEQALID
ncbi:PTS-dependent dihydroxyacetone kinase phosphotransferase subunit DhaM [Halobacillus andaensis]|uniref:phosphoenolpyruvate--glycerone phosphotransferase n=1 Tax=Halobacillus andaensis TaxID=1176239 RepID=A0A917BA42_HALAA|nr:dihydroxyacetone kinase phosphoryl donor subunit DhaM [Halobacillus andaensis]MBP2005294.1 dihydroxyacetone kinase phosphotransfer subunit [Halobacillus andaensis]GGF30361.1 PTS-dependent dihydroxyacetone kinase phosphotransferase subunit DhaM [Halobacillus andaensis]